MEKSVSLWSIMGFAVTALCGTLLHFLYDWLGGSVWVAPFSGVNESTWEHMKLLFWPMFIYAIIQSFFFRDNKNYWCIKLRSSLLGLALIPVLFYTYNGVIGHSPDWINIAIFFIAAAASYIYEARRLNAENGRCILQGSALYFLCIIGLLFVIFTFFTPELDIFKDPLTAAYGI